MKIEIKDLSKNYDEKILFEDFNLVIESGEFVGIYGQSGSGKTTLLNMIGLIEDYSGDIIYDGKVPRKGSDIRSLLSKDVGFVFQNYGLIDNQTVYDNLKYLKKIYKLSKKQKTVEISKVLDKVGLTGYENRKVFSLSGGEQQRVAIARILLKQPKLVLADEPTASLDEENRNIILKYLKEINDTGSTVIVVSHDKEVIDYTNREVLI